VDVKSAAASGTTSSISDSTHSVLSYIESVPDHADVIEALLGKSHSERSWLMGSKEVPSPAKNAESEGGVVNLYVGKCWEVDPACHRSKELADSSSGCTWYPSQSTGETCRGNETANRASILVEQP
jgi:hypothetical protein